MFRVERDGSTRVMEAAAFGASLSLYAGATNDEVFLIMLKKSYYVRRAQFAAASRKDITNNISGLRTSVWLRKANQGPESRAVRVFQQYRLIPAIRYIRRDRVSWVDCGSSRSDRPS
jgi:hypothetical protein